MVKKKHPPVNDSHIDPIKIKKKQDQISVENYEVPSDPRHFFIVTREWIKLHATSNCGYNKDQLAALGVSWPPKKGWLSKIIGKAINLSQKHAFEANSKTAKKKRYRDKIMAKQRVRIKIRKSAKTYQYKDFLKSMYFNWCNQEKQWYLDLDSKKSIPYVVKKLEEIKLFCVIEGS